MTSPPSAMQTRVENAEARERYLKTNLIRSQQELAQANKKNEDLAAKLEAAEKELAEYKQAETDRENERKKVEDDGKQLMEAQAGRLREAKAAGVVGGNKRKQSTVIRLSHPH
ncbi:uncharacterized protein J4E78_001624 [Alternaria triticimaculans]|uniref:uncharacterized protein n=1 Tax=Alternaria triticimaculans TaxID=297637 RepID=UPI0020C548CD|nr:uncharacterized protein J4E78_001624 [Alternaria triticimaculans]KAI4673117.1 hypothetical protein J4E78_001624 [Alternaria triticimaculans]